MMNSFRLHSDLPRNQLESSYRKYSPLTGGVAKTLTVQEHKANGQMCQKRQLPMRSVAGFSRHMSRPLISQIPSIAAWDYGKASTKNPPSFDVFQRREFYRGGKDRIPFGTSSLTSCKCAGEPLKTISGCV
jgi:hypothetical protein